MWGRTMHSHHFQPSSKELMNEVPSQLQEGSRSDATHMRKHQTRPCSKDFPGWLLSGSNFPSLKILLPLEILTQQSLNPAAHQNHARYFKMPDPCTHFILVSLKWDQV